MILTIIGFSSIGLVLGAISGFIYSALLDVDDSHVIVSCLLLGMIFGGCIGIHMQETEQKLNKLPEVLTELNNTKLELERIKQQAVAAGLGYWHEELAVVRRDFVIASQTASFTAEAK